jgi:two-component system phosphate regulon response regulator PhoB
MAENTGAPVQVLVIEDEDDIRNLVVMNLRRAGFEVLSAGNGADGLSLLRQHRPPVICLDLMLPDMSGQEICAIVRQEPDIKNTFVIMVTAMTEEEDRIAGFQVGADDYVTKPFSVKELVLRVQVAARRAQAQAQAAVPDTPSMPEKLSFPGLEIDTRAHRVWIAGEETELTATEYKLLLHLATSEGALCSRGELLEEVWELPPTLNTRTVDTHVKRLRQKLGIAAGLVHTVRGAGYRFGEA